jgi:hypothetical protein
MFQPKTEINTVLYTALRAWWVKRRTGLRPAFFLRSKVVYNITSVAVVFAIYET